MTRYCWGILDHRANKVIAYFRTEKRMRAVLAALQAEDPAGWYVPVYDR